MPQSWNQSTENLSIKSTILKDERLDVSAKSDDSAEAVNSLLRQCFFLSVFNAGFTSFDCVFPKFLLFLQKRLELEIDLVVLICFVHNRVVRQIERAKGFVLR